MSIAMNGARKGFARVVWVVASAFLLSSPLFAETVAINPVKDASLYHPVGAASCGGGNSLFSGINGSAQIRRALLQFDIAGSVPAGAIINSVSLNLYLNRTSDSQDLTMRLHAISQDWGEGTVVCGENAGGAGAQANVGDATWDSAFYQQVLWASPGGDFAAASASTVVPAVINTTYSWDSAVAGNEALVSDVQTWLDSPVMNNGWMLVADETRPFSTSRRFDSREGVNQPELIIDFTPVTPVVACCMANGDCSVIDDAACTSQGGTANGGTTSCSPNPCAQPVGGCCNPDQSCSEAVARDVCESGGGSFKGGGSTCASSVCGLEPFVDELPMPSQATPVGTRADGVDQYLIDMSEVQQQLHRDLPPTTVWGYNGQYPGPTLEVTANQPVEVKYTNSLPPGGHELAVDNCAHGPNYWDDSSRTVSHLHGAHVPSRYDGQPEFDFKPGEFDVYEYSNKQLPAPLWYHDHALGITRLNVYMGLAAFYFIRDAFELSLNLPSGDNEIPMVIQDRKFNADGSLFYPATLQNSFFGDTTLVNGKVWPYKNVKQGKYRLRLLNGSQARVYTLRLENQADPGQVIPFNLIGTDGGLIDAPIPLATVEMAPAERLDVVVDFSGFPAGTEIILANDDSRAPLQVNVMKFIVTAEAGDTSALPGALRPVTLIPEASAAGTRRFLLEQVAHPCSGTEWLVKSLDDQGNTIGEHWDDITEYPILGDTEIWQFENPSNMMHPMHVHLVMFQVLSKEDLVSGTPIPLEPWEIGTWKDTVQVPPGSKVRVIMKFEDYLGKFAYHCHILDHEDQEMMRQYQTTNDPANCNNNGICDSGEDCISCAADCGRVTGSSCGNGLCEMGDGENCVTCPSDCAGDQAAPSPWCCGADTGGVVGSIGCGNDGNGNSCTDGSQDRYCRMMPRVQACCGDALCEGAESVGVCAVDCQDTDGDGFKDIADSDDDSDGLSDEAEALAGTNSLLADSDGDGLADGADGAVPVAALPSGVDADNDGFVDGELDYGTGANNPDSDGDGLGDGLEVANLADPMDPANWPILSDADLAPLGAPDGVVSLGDLLVGVRIAIGNIDASSLELAHGDMNGDGVIDARDVLSIQERLLNP